MTAYLPAREKGAILKVFFYCVKVQALTVTNVYVSVELWDILISISNKPNVGVKTGSLTFFKLKQYVVILCIKKQRHQSSQFRL